MNCHLFNFCKKKKKSSCHSFLGSAVGWPDCEMGIEIILSLMLAHVTKQQHMIRDGLVSSKYLRRVVVDTEGANHNCQNCVVANMSYGSLPSISSIIRFVLRSV